MIKILNLYSSYLQWLIEDQDLEDTQFHTSYALLLAKSAVETSDTQRALQNSKAEIIGETDTTDSGSLSVLQSSVRERMQIFLQSSDLYDPEEVLDLIEGSELWLEKVRLHCYLLPCIFSVYLSTVAINLVMIIFTLQALERSYFFFF